MNEFADSTVDKGLRASAWLLYCVIVFEILFMISPFALYYYSVYSLPLNWLQQSGHTAWLTLHILPHFAYTESFLSNALLLVAWPLILTGLAFFVVGFVQIYWAKFTGKPAVEVGLYRHIRHPQYVALAVVGLGTTLYWSRFIVLIAYVTMLFLYSFLAVHEESVCVAKFGGSYRAYQDRTGMFVPRSWLRRAPKLDWLPRERSRRRAVLGLVYLAVVSATVLLGFGLKRHVVNQLTVSSVDETVLVALAPTSAESLARIQRILSRDEAYREKRARFLPSRVLGYVAPTSWTVPELGLRPPTGHRHSGIAELLHPTIHGNSLEFDGSRFTVLLTEPVLGDADVNGAKLVRVTRGYIPKLKVDIDLASGTVSSISEDPYQSQWKGIPVPVY